MTDINMSLQWVHKQFT
uniref:Uncharacterized protein n=1 Tax=Rhizophora mucronata TaxID=61149 RepID=A0A2P2QGF6_RHIMU